MKVKDPVCGMEIDSQTATYKIAFGGREYSFCSEACKEKFDAHPEAFVEEAGGKSADSKGSVGREDYRANDWLH